MSAKEDILDLSMQRAEAWAESTASKSAHLTERLQRLAEQMHTAREKGDIGEVFSLQSSVVHEITWAVANMHLDAPGNHASLAVQAGRQ